MESLKSFIDQTCEDLDKKTQARFLVIEDDVTYEPIWSHIFRKIDDKAAYDWAKNAKEGEAKIFEALARGYMYDLIICDIFLSDSETGVDLWLKHSDVVQGNLVMVSGIERQKLGNLLGPDNLTPCFFRKPFNPQDCVETLKSLLKKG